MKSTLVKRMNHKVSKITEYLVSLYCANIIEFYGIDIWMLKRAIAALQRQGKAELLAGNAPDDSDSGVKFF